MPTIADWIRIGENAGYFVLLFYVVHRGMNILEKHVAASLRTMASAAQVWIEQQNHPRRKDPHA